MISEKEVRKLLQRPQLLDGGDAADIYNAFTEAMEALELWRWHRPLCIGVQIRKPNTCDCGWDKAQALVREWKGRE